MMKELHLNVLIKILALTGTMIGPQTLASTQELQGIYLREKGNLAMLTLRLVPQLLFTNGEVFTDIDVPPEDFDIAASKQSEPERWGQWRLEGDQFYFTMPDGEKKVRMQNRPMAPASEDQRLDGVWSYQNAGGGANSTIVVERDVGFSPDGIFATGSFSGASTSDPIGGSSATGYTDQGLAPKGTYRISGYTAEFNYQDGRTERTLFFFHVNKDGSADPDYVNLGKTTYILQEGSSNVDMSLPATEPAAPAAAAATVGGKGLAITPGRWTVQLYDTEGDLDGTLSHCITNTVFDPLDILDAGWDQCDTQTEEAGGGRGTYNMACAITEDDQTQHIGIRLDLTIDGSLGQGTFVLAAKGEDGYVTGRPRAIELERSGSC